MVKLFHRVEHAGNFINKLEAKESVTIGFDILDAVFVSKNIKEDLGEITDEVTVKPKKQQERPGVLTKNDNMYLKIFFRCQDTLTPQLI